MVRDYWIYQERSEVEGARWAIYVVKEFTRGKPGTVTLSCTVYSEDINNSAHSASYVGMHFQTVTEYIDYLEAVMYDYAELNDDDKRQLDRELTNIIMEGM